MASFVQGVVSGSAGARSSANKAINSQIMRNQGEPGFRNKVAHEFPLITRGGFNIMDGPLDELCSRVLQYCKFVVIFLVACVFSSVGLFCLLLRVRWCWLTCTCAAGVQIRSRGLRMFWRARHREIRLVRALHPARRANNSTK